jgi:hypothetical protein
MQVYTISARRWFDKPNGNSYFTMRISGEDTSIVSNGNVNIVVPFEYGHGYATYTQRALEVLGLTYEDEKNGNVKFIVDETEVMRKKDLHYGGKYRSALKKIGISSAGTEVW